MFNVYTHHKHHFKRIVVPVHFRKLQRSNNSPCIKKEVECIGPVKLHRGVPINM